MSERNFRLFGNKIWTFPQRKPISQHACETIIKVVRRCQWPTSGLTAATLCVGGPHRGRGGTKSSSASHQIVRHFRLWGSRNPRVIGTGCRTTACDRHALGGDQCGEQRGADLEHSTTTARAEGSQTQGFEHPDAIEFTEATDKMHQQQHSCPGD